MSDDPKKLDEKRSLSEDDVKIDRPIGRRSSMAVLGAAVVGAAAIVAGEPEVAEAQCTDRDPNDAPGRGRVTGVTDRDPNDRPGCGRGRATTGITDRDPNDAPGNGRGARRRCTDSDGGPGADRAGQGRRC